MNFIEFLTLKTSNYGEIFQLFRFITLYILSIILYTYVAMFYYYVYIYMIKQASALMCI